MTEKNWGSLPPVEGSMQITRSMLDLRKPKSFCPEEVVRLEVKESVKSSAQENLAIYSKNNVKLIDYINRLEYVMSDLNPSSNSSYPNYPTIDSPIKKIDDNTLKVESNCCNFSNGADILDVQKNLKHGIGLIAASSGFGMASSIALKTVIDATHHYMETICKSLKSTMDNEALTGKTGFYDSVDQVLHDMGVGSIHDLFNFYEKSVIQFNKILISKSEKLKLQTLQDGTIQTVVKQEKLLNNFIPVVKTSLAFDISKRAKPFVTNEPSIPLHHQGLSNIKIKSQTSDNYSSSNDGFWPNAKRFCS